LLLVQLGVALDAAPCVDMESWAVEPAVIVIEVCDNDKVEVAVVSVEVVSLTICSSIWQAITSHDIMVANIKNP
jgi:hypothetical protein